VSQAARRVVLTPADRFATALRPRGEVQLRLRTRMAATLRFYRRRRRSA